MVRQELADGGLLLYLEGFLQHVEAEAMFAQLREAIPWSQQTLRIVGRPILEPRLTAWFGDVDARYRYSGIVREPLPWTPVLADLRARVSLIADVRFNSMLANQYRDENDSVGYHADAERELGDGPVIASVSLGAARRFVLRHKRRKDLAPIRLVLPGGSLLVMAGTTQRFWRHAVPKEAKSVGPRINLTFRRIETKVRDKEMERQ